MKNGGDEAGCRSRGTGTGEDDGRGKAQDRPICFDTGHCRVDHCGRAACQGAKHQQAITSSDIRHNGQHWAGKNDPRKDRALDARRWRPVLSGRPMCKRYGIHSAVHPVHPRSGKRNRAEFGFRFKSSAYCGLVQNLVQTSAERAPFCALESSVLH